MEKRVIYPKWEVSFKERKAFESSLCLLIRFNREKTGAARQSKRHSDSEAFHILFRFFPCAIQCAGNEMSIAEKSRQVHKTDDMWIYLK